ncbi:MAG TPA: histidine phosphatase family protein [Candidatus Limnocylindrales bacterium]
MIELHFLRHAHAGIPEAWNGPDAARPLSDKGEKQADRLGRFLAGVRFAPDAIITSPKLRARQTAEIVAGHLGLSVALDERLASGFDVSTVEAILADAGDPTRPVLAGHDPDFSEIVATLTGAAGLTMAKGAIVRIDIERPLAEGAGNLVWLVPPDLLKPRGR